MLLVNNELEQTLLLPTESLEGLYRMSAAGTVDGSSLSAPTVESLKQAGLLDGQASLTPAGRQALELMQSPPASFSAHQLHAPQENTLNIAMGNSQSIVWANLIDAAGQARGKSIFSRTIPEMALQHALAWIGLPCVGQAGKGQTSIAAQVLTDTAFSASSRGWALECSALPGQLSIVFYEGFLWRIREVSAADPGQLELDLESEDTLFFNMMIHYLWSRCIRD